MNDLSLEENIQSTIRQNLSVNKIFLETDLSDLEKCFNVFIVSESNDLVEESQKGTDKVEAWAMGFDISYVNTNEDTDPLFNTDLWISNYTKQPIPRIEMEEWVNKTINKLIDVPEGTSFLNRVLEVGCGSGLILYPLLPRIKSYVGMDSSLEALNLITKACREKGIKNVQLLHADAMQIADHNLGKFDTIIVNSVAQYFPDIDYFIKFFDQLSEVCSDKCRILLGDIKNSLTLNQFHSEVLFDTCDKEMDIKTFRKKLSSKIRRDKELAFNPQIFPLIQEKRDHIKSIDLQIREGEHYNEMNNFRYDVLLEFDRTHTGSKQNSAVKPTVLDWVREGLDLNKFKALISEKSDISFIVDNIPNSRTVRSSLIFELSQQLTDDQKVTDLEVNLANEMGNSSAIDPTELWLASTFKNQVRLSFDLKNGEGRIKAFVACDENEDNQNIEGKKELLCLDSNNLVNEKCLKLVDVDESLATHLDEITQNAYKFKFFDISPNLYSLFN